MEARTRRALNQVRRPEVYEEALIDSGGVPVALSIWHAEQPQATVVFLPGTMVHPLFYGEFLDRLAAAGFTVVGVHGQGHGKSPRTRSPLTFPALVRNASDAVTYALERFGAPVVALGSSQGGMLAMAVAAHDTRLAGVMAHNILDPADPAALHATRFPSRLAAFHRPLRAGLRVAGRLLPWIPVPISAYLDLSQVCREDWSQEQFRSDPLALRTYPLRFIASLFTADMSGLADGSIHCPVVVIASDGDAVFDIGDTRRLYERIVAPRKQLVVFPLDHHLILNECVEEVLPTIVAELAALAHPGPPVGASAGAAG
jgi:alpha-beta hydrolase superfamily lysophospholipase